MAGQEAENETGTDTMFKIMRVGFFPSLLLIATSLGGEKTVNLVVPGRASSKQGQELQDDLLKRTRLATNGKQRFPLLPKGVRPVLISPRFPICLNTRHVRDATEASSKRPSPYSNERRVML